MRFIILSLFTLALVRAEDAPVQIARIQADAVDGVIVSLTIYDHPLQKNPVTDAIEAGPFLPPVVITAKTHPALFAELNKLDDKATERLQTAKAAAVARAAATEQEAP